MRVLLHACCAPCLIYPYRKLSEEHEVDVFWYNPNIQPYREYLRRLYAIRKYARNVGINLIENLEYPLEEWLLIASKLSIKSNVLRCKYCYAMRFKKTASYAKEHGYDAFTTTLLLAPYQKHELIKEIGENIARIMRIEFLYIDFRDHFDEAERMAKEAGIYRQGYCGCVFSEADRYWKDIP